MNAHAGVISVGMLFAVLACNLSQNQNQTASVNQSSVNQSKDENVKVLGTFTNRLKMVNKYLLVKKGLTEDELVALAKNLHRKEPDVYFWFLDDDSKSDEMMKWVEAYAAGEADLSDPVTDWMSQHMVANLQQYLREGGRYWALSKGMFGDKIAEID